MIRKKLKRTAKAPFNAAHVATLEHGWPYDDALSLYATAESSVTIDHDRIGPPLDRKACAAAWHELGRQIMSQWIPDHPGTRPWAFWIFERKEPQPPSKAEQLVRLIELGDLTIEEDTWFRGRARTHISAADRGFFLAVLDGERPADGDAWQRLFLVLELLACAGPTTGGNDD